MPDILNRPGMSPASVCTLGTVLAGLLAVIIIQRLMKAAISAKILLSCAIAFFQIVLPNLGVVSEFASPSEVPQLTQGGMLLLCFLWTRIKNYFISAIFRLLLLGALIGLLSRAFS